MTKKTVKLGLVSIRSVSERIAVRKALDRNIAKVLQNGHPNVRKMVSLSMIVETQELWTVWDADSLPTYHSETGLPVFRIWPHADIAKQFGQDNIATPRLVPIPVPDFIDEVLYGVKEDVGVIWCPIGFGHKAVVDHRDQFINTVAEEWRDEYGKPTVR